MVATPNSVFQLFIPQSPSRHDLGCDRWRLHWGLVRESSQLIKYAELMFFFNVYFPLVFRFVCFVAYLYIFFRNHSCQILNYGIEEIDIYLCVIFLAILLSPFTHTHLVHIMSEALYQGLSTTQNQRGCVAMSLGMHFLFGYCENPNLMKD